jgi:hypothetical protein
MVAMSEKPKPKKGKVKRVRNVVFVTLDDATETALEKFRASQRIPPERSAVGFAALVEFLTREGFKPGPA